METLTPTKVAPIFVPTSDWDAYSNFCAGILLRRYGYVIDCCENAHQRRGYYSEWARQLHVAKPPKFRKPDLSTPVDAAMELPY